MLKRRIKRLVKRCIPVSKHRVVREYWLYFRRKILGTIRKYTNKNRAANVRARVLSQPTQAGFEAYSLQSSLHSHLHPNQNYNLNYNQSSVVYLESPDCSELLYQQQGVSGLPKNVSVITLNRNGAALLSSFFDGFYHLSNLNVELIFVDHASTDNSVELVRHYIQQFDHVTLKLIQKEENDKFSVSNNDAVELASHPYVLFLNNDVVITEHTHLKNALGLLSADDMIGAVGWQLYHDNQRQQIQHNGIAFDWDDVYQFFRPYNITQQHQTDLPLVVREYEAVTAALLLMRKTDFQALEGFCPDYNYGYEDVDLCLSITSRLNKKCVIVTGYSAVHQESTTQKRQNKFSVAKRRKNNIEVFKKRYGRLLRQRYFESLFSPINPFKATQFVFGLVVTESGPDAKAGDYFTALELALALEETFSCKVKFIEQKGKTIDERFDCRGIDVLIVLLDKFDLSQIQNASALMISVAWMRNWFDRWAQHNWFGQYDIYLSSSNTAIDYLKQQYHIQPSLLRLASNEERFETGITEHNGRSLDVVFTGSYWNVKRDIENYIAHLRKYKFRIYGFGWEEKPEYNDIHAGGVRYKELPQIYRKSKIVIDDAASSTSKWGSINSRVFDATFAGCLVLSNGQQGAKEFLQQTGIQIPVYSNAQELLQLLDYYLHNEAARQELVEKLKKQMRAKHTYRLRAVELCESIKAFAQTKRRIAIKVPVPSEKEKPQWGDYHFATSLAKYFKQDGHAVRIDILPEWYESIVGRDDVSIVLRGLSEFQPIAGQVSMMWNISHPDKVTIEEYEKFDLVYIPSKKYTEKLTPQSSKVEFKTLYQCTDGALFFPDSESEVDAGEILFVGNSRKIYRDIVKHAVEAQLPLTVYGAMWETYLPENVVKAENIPNSQLRYYYSKADVVLNDHWGDMRAYGYISNRLFDVAACAGVVVTDRIDGLRDIFGENVVEYDNTVEGLKSAIDKARQIQKADCLEQSQLIRQHHSFEARAHVILDDISRIFCNSYTGMDKVNQPHHNKKFLLEQDSASQAKTLNQALG